MKRVQGAVGSGKLIPILGNVLIEARAGGQLRLRATDNDVEAWCELSATVDRPGQACVEARLLQDVLQNAPEGAELGLDLGAGENRVTVQVARSRFRLPTLPASDFPQPKSDPGREVRGKLPAKDLVRLLDNVAFAAADEEVRFYLNGAYLQVLPATGGSILRSVATNGSVLAWCDAPCPADLEGLEPSIWPRRFLAEAKRWLGDLSCEVELVATPERVALEIPSARLASRLIDGRYPDYQRVVPKARAATATVDAKLFCAALRRVLIASLAEAAGKVRAVKIDFTDGQAKLYARSLLRGDAEEVVELVYAGEDQTIGFNGPHMLELVEKVAGDKIDLVLNGPNEPVLVLDPADPSRLTLATSLRV